MTSYNYGPPPPAPPAIPPGPPPSYPPYDHAQPYQHAPHRGGHSSRGRGGPVHSGDRGGYHNASAAYGYATHQPPYGQQPTQYTPHQGGYPPAPQHWLPEPGQPHHPQPQPQLQSPANPQNYHPNYAPQPQVYQGGQQVLPYNQPQQQPYVPPPQPHYAQPYQQPPPQHGPPSQPWAGHQLPASRGQFTGGRGGHGGYGERGGSKAPVMGPPIRLGFDANNPQRATAPVSAGYPPSVYNGSHGPPAPYPAAPFQGYPPPAPYVAGPPKYDNSSHNPHQRHGRGGFHSTNSFKGRSQQFGGDKMRSRNRGAAAQTPPMHYQKPDAASAGKKKKRKTNTLGLTPGEESEEDDENEEEKLTELIGADAPNPADIAAWIEERRRNYPTKARVEAKLRAAAKAQTGETKKSNEDRDAELEKQQQKAEKLRKQLEKVESRIKRKREQQDEGDEMRDVDESSSSLDSSDDEKPETMSTRQEYHLPAPPKKADPTKHCKYYSTGGTCGKKGKCRFVHDPAVREAALREREMNGGRMTLQQRLILNDKEQEDLTIVQTLKYLQDKGLLQAKDTPTPSNAQSSTSQSSVPATVSKEQNHGLPAIPPPSVVPSTSTAKYIGWNLSGFGNTGVKSDG